MPTHTHTHTGLQTKHVVLSELPSPQPVFFFVFVPSSPSHAQGSLVLLSPPRQPDGEVHSTRVGLTVASLCCKTERLCRRQCLSREGKGGCPYGVKPSAQPNPSVQLRRLDLCTIVSASSWPLASEPYRTRRSTARERKPQAQQKHKGHSKRVLTRTGTNTTGTEKQAEPDKEPREQKGQQETQRRRENTTKTKQKPEQPRSQPKHHRHRHSRQTRQAAERNSREDAAKLQQDHKSTEPGSTLPQQRGAEPSPRTERETQRKGTAEANAEPNPAST